MATGTVFTNNRTQAVRLPAQMRLPDGVKHVNVRACGHERVISPINETWTSFFLDSPQASQDFMTERATQEQPEREAF